MPMLNPEIRLNDVPLAGPDVVSLFNRNHEDSAVSYFARPCGFHGRFDDAVDHFVWNDDFDHHLWQKRNAVFGASIYRFVALLASMPTYFSDGHTGHMYRG